ncbi:MAG: CHAD domain-containing protein [Sporichthyaceae bacterium]
MTGEFSVAAGLDRSAVALLTESLPARLAATAQEQRVWLDTHDWLLFKAGLVLEQRSDNLSARLLLHDRAGGLIAEERVGRRIVTAATLPAGELRTRVEAALWIRALLPRLTANGPSATLAVLDGEEKTVARVTVDGPLEVNGSPGITRVRLEPLRGYDKQARKVGEQLSATKGLKPTDAPMFAALAAAAGLTPGWTRSGPEPTFTRKTPSVAAFAETMAQLGEVVQDNLDGTIKELDTEFLHDFRVAARRSRSVLKVAVGVLDEALLTYYTGELKWLGDATSLSRDLDVNLLDFGQGLDEVDAAAVGPFRDLLEKRCRKAHLALNRVLRSDRCAVLLKRWETDFARDDIGGPDANVPSGELAKALLNRTWKRVGKRGAAITPDSPADDLHDLRKRAKELRYLLEFFSVLYDKTELKAFVVELKKLQDLLGEFQDAEAQWFLIRDCAQELRAGSAPIDTVLAMGRMSHDLRKRQEAAHHDFAAIWARFYSTANRRAFAELVAKS